MTKLNFDNLFNNGKTGRIAVILAIAAGLFILYFAGMNSYPLLDPDEPIYGQVAKEMAYTGQWLTPHYKGNMWFDKPPLFYWVSAASVKLFGLSEASVRLPSALFAVALVLLIFYLASYDFGKKTGLISAAVFAVCIQQIVLARACVTDMVFVFFLIAALYCFRVWLDKCDFKWAFLLGISTGLAVLAKGPVAYVLISITMLITLLWTKNHKRLVSPSAFIGLLTALAVSLPWYLAMYFMHRESFVNGFLVANNLTRFLKPEHESITGGWQSYFMNIPTLIAFFFPWSLFLPQAIAANFKANIGAKLFFVWIAVVYIFFSISKTQLPTYIFPLYPVAAIFVGALWTSLSTQKCDSKVKVVLWINAVLSLMIAAFLAISAQKKYPMAFNSALILGSLLFITALSALICYYITNRTKPTAPIWVIGIGMSIFTIWLVLGVIPFVSPMTSTKDVVLKVPYRSKIISYHMFMPSVYYYSLNPPIEPGNLNIFKQEVKRNKNVYIICEVEDISILNKLGIEKVMQKGKFALFYNGTDKRGVNINDK